MLPNQKRFKIGKVTGINSRHPSRGRSPSEPTDSHGCDRERRTNTPETTSGSWINSTSSFVDGAQRSLAIVSPNPNRKIPRRHPKLLDPLPIAYYSLEPSLHRTPREVESDSAVRDRTAGSGSVLNLRRDVARYHCSELFCCRAKRKVSENPLGPIPRMNLLWTHDCPFKQSKRNVRISRENM